MKKSVKLAVVFLVALSFLCVLIHSDELPDTSPAPKEDEKIKLAIQSGLDWLAANQNNNGSWTCKIGCKLNETYISNEENDNVAVTAIAGMSFLAQGSTPGRGKYGKNVEKALNFVLSCVRTEDGYITKYGSRMYEHAFATLFLAEIYGMSPKEELKLKLKKAAALIVQSQNKEGGWRYQPSPVDADISVTVTTLQALRAARNVGISVPKDVIENAMKYVHLAATPSGSFRYQLTGDSRTSPALTAAGVVALMSAGEYDSKEVENGLRYLSLTIPVPFNNQYPYHYFYGHYYIAQAMYQGGEKYWSRYRPIVHRDFLKAQKAEGNWADDVGETYATAMATLILQITSEYLPIFQR